MSRSIIDIQSNDFVILANKIDKIGRADLPVAVRGTLNQVAVNMKGGRGATVPRGLVAESAEKGFDNSRSKNLFTFMTDYTKATTLEINSMKSVAGIVKKANRQRLAENLGRHETGKTFKSKSTPFRQARRGKNKRNKVVRRLYIEKLLQNSIDVRGYSGQAFIARAIAAYNNKKFIIMRGKNGDSLIASVSEFNRTEDSVRFDTQIYYRLNHSGNIKAKKENRYISKAGIIAMKDVDLIFKREAEKRIAKTLRK